MPEKNTNSVKPLEGKTAIDDKMFFEPERLSYQSADGIAQKIAEQVRKSVEKETVVIVGQPLLADFANLQAAYLTLEGLQREYGLLADHSEGLAQRLLPGRPKAEKAEAPPPAEAVPAFAVLAPITGAINAALGLVSLFREDVEYSGVKTVLDPLTFELALASKIRASGANEVFVADLMFVPLAEARKDSLRWHLARVQEAKARAWTNMGPLIGEVIRVEGELDDAARSKDQERFDGLSRQLSVLRGNMEPITTPLGRLDQRLADLQNRWNQTDEKTALSVLARLLRAEAIHELGPKYLHAKVVSSGGHHRVSRSLLRMIFTGDGLSFAGGAIARWALLNTNGSVENGGMLVERR